VSRNAAGTEDRARFSREPQRVDPRIAGKKSGPSPIAGTNVVGPLSAHSEVPAMAESARIAL